jgi:hypothetical protein
MGPEEASKPNNQRSYLAYMGPGETSKPKKSAFLFSLHGSWRNFQTQ